MPSSQYHLANQQRGVALVIGLVILVLLTLLSLAAMRKSSMQERISGNMYERNLSFQAAESALREGENWVEALVALPTPVASCDDYPCVVIHDSTTLPENQDNNWWENNSAEFSGGVLTNVAVPPRYVIEYLDFVTDDATVGHGPVTGKHYYAITARGTSGTQAAQAILRSTYVKRH